MIIAVPYHLDEPQPALPVPADVVLTMPAGAIPGWAGLAELYDDVAAAVVAGLDEVDSVVVAAGDCTTSLGVLAGLHRWGLPPGIVWLDAHADFNTAVTTPSGYLGGMPLAVACGIGEQTVPRRLGSPPTPSSQVLLVGARDVDPGEERLLGEAGIPRVGLEGCVEAALPSGPLYLHLDLDLLDPAELSGLRYPAPGGPTLDGFVAAVQRVMLSGRVAAVGLACTWRPGLADSLAEQVVQVVQAILAVVEPYHRG